MDLPLHRKLPYTETRRDLRSGVQETLWAVEEIDAPLPAFAKVLSDLMRTPRIL